MTAAVATANLDDLRDSDADLVRGSMAGDRTAFAQIYDRYADRLHDYCVRMLRDRDGAADCVQEAFCVAATRLPQLRDPEKLRPWLYAIARNEALARLRERRRETPFGELPDIESHDATPDNVAARAELADLIAKAAGGLSDRDRMVFDLAFHHGMSGPDLADALEISHANANKIVLRLRRTIERSLGALLLSRRAESRGGCTELGEILAGWDGQLTVLMRKRISRHVESCPPCDDEQRRLVNPAALLSTTPIFVAAPDWLRERTLSEVQLTSHGSQMEGETDDAGILFDTVGAVCAADDAAAADAEAVSAADAGARRRNRRWLWAAVLLLAVLGASAGLTFAWDAASVTISPTDVGGTAHESNGQTPTPSNLPPTPIILQTPTIAPTPQPPVIHIPTVEPPQGPVVHIPTEKPSPQAPVLQAPLPMTPHENAPTSAGLPPVDKPTLGSERKSDVRRFPAARRDSGSAPGSSPSLQRSSQQSVAPPSASRAAMRPAQVSDPDPEANSPTPRQAARGSGGSDDSPADSTGSTRRRAVNR
jgi:RNA polymerase sigma factor (sigma-70 family)